MIILRMPLSSKAVNLFFQLLIFACLELELFCSLIFCCTNEKTYYTQIKRWKRYWEKEKEKKERMNKKKRERKRKKKEGKRRRLIEREKERKKKEGKKKRKTKHIK